MSDIETTENNKNNFLPGQGSNSQEAAQRLQDIGSSILRAARDELYLGMRFLDVALSSFIYQMDGSVSPFGTDGAVMYFHPAQLGGLYKENRILVNRGYLHMVFHCIFRHFGKPGIEKRLWNLSCDIAVEHMIDGIYHRSVRYSRSLLRRETYRLLEKEKKTLNAERIYKILKEEFLKEKELAQLEKEFYVDDHKYWANQQPDRKPNPLMSKKWGDISDGIETDLETFSSEAGAQDGDFLDQLKVENRERYDYREFLRKFGVCFLIAVGAVVQTGNIDHGGKSVGKHTRYLVHAAGDGAGRIFTMTDFLQELRNFVSDMAALGGNLIADAPHYHTRIVPILMQHIYHILFCPFVEIAVISILTFGNIPFIERFQHHHEAHLVTEFHQFGGRHIVGGTDCITSHILQ